MAHEWHRFSSVPWEWECSKCGAHSRPKVGNSPNPDIRIASDGYPTFVECGLTCDEWFVKHVMES